MTKVVGTTEPEDARRATRYLLDNVLSELGKPGQKDAVLQACSKVRYELNRIDQGKSLQLTRYLLDNVLSELGKAGQKDAVLQACYKVRYELNRIDQGKSLQLKPLTLMAPLALKILEDVLKSVDPD